MDKKLLPLLRCPTTYKGLHIARGDLLDKVNAAIAEGRVHNRDGEALDTALESALVTDDDKLMYPVVAGIPVMLEGQSIAMEQLN